MHESLHEGWSLASLGAKAKPVNAHKLWVIDCRDMYILDF